MDTLKKVFITLSAASCMLANSFAMAGEGALLGLNPTYPNISFQTLNAQGDGAIYDGVNLIIVSTPTFVTYTSGDSDIFVVNGNLSLTATIDASGNFGGGSYTISGVTTDSLYSGVLLSGDVTDYGIINAAGAGGTDLSDFALTVTGGALKPLFDAVSGLGAAAEIALENSTYDGSFASIWTAVNAKGDIGPIPDVPPLPSKTIGYWKNHLDVWSGVTLSICGKDLNQAEAVSILSLSSKGDKTVIMAKQLIASMLNQYVGNSCSTIPAAEAWLCDHGGIGDKRRHWDGGEVLKDTLDNFNNGGTCL